MVDRLLCRCSNHPALCCHSDHSFQSRRSKPKKLALTLPIYELYRFSIALAKGIFSWLRTAMIHPGRMQLGRFTHTHLSALSCTGCPSERILSLGSRASYRSVRFLVQQDIWLAKLACWFFFAFIRQILFTPGILPQGYATMTGTSGNSELPRSSAQ